MGTPLPPLPPDPGDLCVNCWGEDSEFGLVTPRVLSITLYDLEEGEFWNEIYRDELFTPTDLIQNAMFPCFFANLTTNFTWFVEFGNVGTQALVELRFFPNRDAYRFFTVDLCVRDRASDIVGPGGVIAFNGTGSIYLGST